MCQTSTHGYVAGADDPRCAPGDWVLKDGCKHSVDAVLNDGGAAMRRALASGHHVYVRTEEHSSASAGPNRLEVYKSTENGRVTGAGLRVNGRDMPFDGTNAGLLRSVNNALTADGSLVTNFPHYEPAAITDYPATLAN